MNKDTLRVGNGSVGYAFTMLTWLFWQILEFDYFGWLHVWWIVGGMVTILDSFATVFIVRKANISTQNVFRIMVCSASSGYPMICAKSRKNGCLDSQVCRCVRFWVVGMSTYSFNAEWTGLQNKVWLVQVGRVVDLLKVSEWPVQLCVCTLCTLDLEERSDF